MTVMGLKRLIKRISYKPLWSFEVHEPTPLFHEQQTISPFVYVIVKALVPDASHPEEQIIENSFDPRGRIRVDQVMIEVQFRYTINQHVLKKLDEELMIKTLIGFIRKIEQHEMDEFLKLDGKHITDPH